MIFPPRPSVRRWRTVAMRSSVTLLFLLLLQSHAWAYALPPTVSRLGIIQPIGLIVGVFVGSFLVVESRRFRDFIWGLLLMFGAGMAIALLSITGNIQSEIQALLPVVLMGLGLGITITGLWWWGHRQAYAQALVATLRGKPMTSESQGGLPAKIAGFFNTLRLQAQAIRYRRLVNSGDMNTLSMAIRHQLQQDWEHYQTAQLEHKKAEKRKHIHALLAKADHACGQSPFASAATISNPPQNQS